MATFKIYEFPGMRGETIILGWANQKRDLLNEMSKHAHKLIETGWKTMKVKKYGIDSLYISFAKKVFRKERRSFQ